MCCPHRTEWYRPSTKVYAYSVMHASDPSTASAQKQYPRKLIILPFLLISFPQLRVLLLRIQVLRKKVFSFPDDSRTDNVSNRSVKQELSDEEIHLLMSLDRIYDSFSCKVQVLQRRITAFYLKQRFLSITYVASFLHLF